MRPRTAALGLLPAALLMLGPAVPGAAAPSRASTSGNLILNAGAETTTPAPSSDGMAKVALANWQVSKKSQYTAVAYGTANFLPANATGPAGRGLNFFTGGSHGGHSVASQTIALKTYSHWIKTGHAAYVLSGWLGGFESQRDDAVVKVTWLDATGSRLGSGHIGPVTPGDRHSKTELLKRSHKGLVPRGAKSVKVTVTMTRRDGYYVDGYADNLALVVKKS